MRRSINGSILLRRIWGPIKLAGCAAWCQFKLDAMAIDVDGQIMAVLIGQGRKLPVDQKDRSIYTIVGSRSHGTPELEAFVAAKKREKGAVEFIAAGSSLKICLVAEGCRGHLSPVGAHHGVGYGGRAGGGGVFRGQCACV